MRRWLFLITASGTVLAAPFAPGMKAARAATAPTTATFTVNGGSLSIAAPASATMGTVPAGTSTISAALGTTTVSDLRAQLGGSWTATVSATPFTTGAGSPAQTVPAGNISYTPGSATSTSGTGTFTAGPGSSLGASQTAFTATAEIGVTSCSWNPTLTVTLPSAVVAGTYSGTITHSVA